LWLRVREGKEEEGEGEREREKEKMTEHHHVVAALSLCRFVVVCAACAAHQPALASG